MTTDKVLHSDLAVPPGEFLAEILESRRISQADLARRMGRPMQAINEIVKGEKVITPETAIQLEQVLGVPAHVWTGMESECQLVRARAQEAHQVSQETDLLDEISYPHLVKLGVVQAVRGRAERIGQLKTFFGVASLENLAQVRAYSPAFRVSQTKAASPYALAAWLRCGELRAHDIEAKPFSRESLTNALAEIRRLTNEPPKAFAAGLKKRLADCGVALVVLPHLPRTYAHGATFWLSPDKAVVMMSIRCSWADIFWFSLFHELGHVLLHGNRMTFIEDGDSDAETGNLEEAANRFAAEVLIPPENHAQLRTLPLASAERIVACAKTMGIHPGIVVGRLQHDGQISQVTPLNRLRTRLKWAV
jgi:HTH-type transcriptional regulator / antitoxin HigA